MSTIRYFSGGRDTAESKSVAAEIMRIEFQKKGKMSSTDRFKLIMKRKMEEHKKSLGSDKLKPLSQRAEQALKQVAARKAAKDAKKLQQSVIVQSRVFPNGRITQKGKILDIAGNMVASVDTKNGKIATNTGWKIGKYKPNKRTESAIQDAIYKYSPYYINLRKMQQMQQEGIDPLTGRSVKEVINIYHHDDHDHHHSSGSIYGEDGGGSRKGVSGSAWGARSENVWGTFGENAWGTSMDNVWGKNSTDVWGGVGSGSPYGKGANVFGTGNGKNYLKKVTNYISSLLGIKNKKTVDAFKAHRQSRTSSPGSSGSARAPVNTGGRSGRR